MGIHRHFEHKRSGWEFCLGKANWCQVMFAAEIIGMHQIEETIKKPVVYHVPKIEPPNLWPAAVDGIGYPLNKIVNLSRIWLLLITNFYLLFLHVCKSIKAISICITYYIHTSIYITYSLSQTNLKYKHSKNTCLKVSKLCCWLHFENL